MTDSKADSSQPDGDDAPSPATTEQPPANSEEPKTGFAARLEQVRARSGNFNHFFLAFKRYSDVGGGQLSAAISYYAFFAAFSLSLLAVSIFGYMLNFPRLYAAVEEWLETNLPVIDVNMLEDSRAGVGILALAGLLIAGVAWVKAVRFAVRTIWGLEPEPGNPVVRWIVDLGVLIGLGALLVTTISITASAEWLVIWINDEAVQGGPTFLIALSSFLLGIVVNAVLAAAILQALPRLRLPLRRIIGAALAVAIGLELLKTVGRFYITSATDRPAYQAVATAVGLLVFLYVFNQMFLFAASWTATSSRGTAYDLSERENIDQDQLVEEVTDDPYPSVAEESESPPDDAAESTEEAAAIDSKERSSSPGQHRRDNGDD